MVKTDPLSPPPPFSLSEEITKGAKTPRIMPKSVRRGRRVLVGICGCDLEDLGPTIQTKTPNPDHDSLL